MTCLDPPDTERLRRVCRSWKALSQSLLVRELLHDIVPWPILHYLSIESLPMKTQRTHAFVAGFAMKRVLQQDLHTASSELARLLCSTFATTFNSQAICVVGCWYGSCNQVQTILVSRATNLSLKKILRPFIAVDLWLMAVFTTVDGDLISLVS
jgi:hypothetical protein